MTKGTRYHVKYSLKVTVQINDSVQLEYEVEIKIINRILGTLF